MKKFTFLLSLFLFAPFVAAQSGHTVTLSWSASPDSTTTNPGTVNVWRSAGACSTGAPSGATQLTASAPAGGPYVDSSVQAGSTYCYYVTATISGATSGPSNTTQAAVGPFPPSGLTVTVH